MRSQVWVWENLHQSCSSPREEAFFPFPSFFRGSVNHPKCVLLFYRNPTRAGDEEQLGRKKWRVFFSYRVNEIKVKGFS